MDDDYYIDFDSDPCPRCGHDEIRSRSCDVIGCDDGYIDEYDDDPINFAPGEEFEVCHECHGYGFLRWCPKCGLDLNLEKSKEQA